MSYNIYNINYKEKQDVLDIIYGSYSDDIDKEIEEVYRKAESWDKMHKEFKTKKEG
jgi:hypothetical protein